MASEEFEAASRQHWARAAEAWAEESASREDGPAGAAADRMLELAALGPGERVLELACGAADVGVRAARAVGSDGYVLCTDFVPEMVDAVRERASELPQVDARVHDAQEPIGESFDAALCRFGYMLMPDPARALTATREALRPGGRVVLAVWGTGEQNPWLSLIFDAVMGTLGAPPPPAGTPGPFAFAEHEALTRRLAEAGFEEVTCEDVASERRHESLSAWWENFGESAGAVGSVLAQLPAEQLAEVRRRAEAAAERYASERGVVMPASVVVARAVRP